MLKFGTGVFFNVKTISLQLLIIQGPTVISSNPSWQREDYKQEIVDDSSVVDTEAGTSVLGLQFMKIPGQKIQSSSKSHLLPFLNAASQSQIK
jgi:hypothetical protein